jgi:hypothetical protein
MVTHGFYDLDDNTTTGSVMSKMGGLGNLKLMASKTYISKPMKDTI